MNTDQTRAEAINELRNTAPELTNLLSIFDKYDLMFKEIRIKVNFPFKKIANFIIVKQIILSFKIGDNKFSPYKLYLQHLVTSNSSDLEKSVRLIWSYNGKFIPDSDTKVNPELMSVIFKLGETFGLYSPITDLPFPFPIRLLKDPITEEMLAT